MHSKIRRWLNNDNIFKFLVKLGIILILIVLFLLILLSSNPNNSKVEEPVEDTLDINLVISSDNPIYADYLFLATTIYCEATANLEESVAVGWVVMNRMNDKEVWGDDSLLEVVSRKGQFECYSPRIDSNFNKVLLSIEESDTYKASISKIAALCVLYDIELYKIPEDVQFFCSYAHWNKVKGDSGNWGKYDKYSQIGDTVFFYKY